ncbi:MAG: glycogen/starch synthase [Candidatus Lokiarchaeota archaeon]|nr:glycogen/starch synthase [Candidatus Lokiarchaeota archaeon]
MIGPKKKVWILTFEYTGIVKIGGLGEVPTNQAKYLKDIFDITVFIPSHGQIERLKEFYLWKKSPYIYHTKIDPSFLGIFNQEEEIMISYYEFLMDGVKILLITGENAFTKRFLDDNAVYNPETFNGKIIFFSLGIRAYINYLLSNNYIGLPFLVHLHDYHVVPAYINIKQELHKKQKDISSIITLHLLTHPRQPIQFYEKCGIDNTPIKIRMKEEYKNYTIEQIFSICDNNSIFRSVNLPSIEKIGAIVSDLVTTVSESYLKSDIIPNFGAELIEFKTDFIWNGCDWDYEEINTKVLNNFGNEIREFLKIPINLSITRENLKKYLLTYKIGNLNKSPLINSKKILDVINVISNDNPLIKNGNTKVFEDSGPLVITTGRISPQKGFEVVFESISEVIKIFPNAKFLFLVLPTEYSLNEIQYYASFVKTFPNNVRIIFGIASEIFYLAHMAADVYCALSRWEPFGIIALEAMALKLPIIATKVGGLQESIIDIRSDKENCTGYLIDKETPKQFTEALISFFHLAEISKSDDVYKTEILQMINQIPDEVIKSRVILDPHFYQKIRENCYNRVQNNFRWNIVTKKLIKLYNSFINY